MLILRLVLILGLISILVSVGIYLLTRDRRYLRFAWQLFKFAVLLLLVLAAIMFFGRMLL